MRAFTLFALPLLARAVPTFPNFSPVARDNSKVPYLINDNCHGDEKHYESLLYAAREAEGMIKTALKEWWDEGKHREVAATYLAIPDTDNFKDDSNAQLAHGFLERASHLFGGIPAFASYVDYRCDDPDSKCVGDKDDEGRPVKASTVGNTVYVCNYFWNEQTTDNVYNTYKDLDKKYIVLKGLQGTYTRSFIHELFHAELVTEDRPHPVDMIYQGKRAYGAEVISEWVLEYKAKPEDVLKNADSFAIFVIAIYWKNKFGFLPEPDQEDMFRDNKECANSDGFEYFARETAIKHVEAFCDEAVHQYEVGKGGTFEKIYEEGKPESTMWSLTTTSKSRKPGSEVHSKCLQAMGELIDGCDTNDGTWKTGGGFTWGSEGNNEYVFSIAPKRERPWPKGEIVGDCDVWYKFPFYDEFFIHGGSWAGDDHGQSKLLPALLRCGSVTEWEFEYYDEPKDDNTEWRAYGRLPIGAQQWNCVRQAVVDSGGPSNIGCGGK